MAKKTAILLLCLSFFSCQPEKVPGAIGTNAYFNLKGYFEKEINRYSTQKPTVEKTVAINGKTETKTQEIKDWPRELAVFVDADINKSAWKGFFTVDSLTNKVVYATADDKIPVKKVSVLRKNDKITKIEVVISNHNILYHSNDTLTYYPDSLYKIVKQQKIKLMEGKRYEIVGKIK